MRFLRDPCRSPLSPAVLNPQSIRIFPVIKIFIPEKRTFSLVPVKLFTLQRQRRYPVPLKKSTPNTSDECAFRLPPSSFTGNIDVLVDDLSDAVLDFNAECIPSFVCNIDRSCL